jgi:hypothetical protein
VINQRIKAIALITYRRSIMAKHKEIEFLVRGWLTPIQEEIVAILRQTLFLPLDDLLIVTKEFINTEARVHAFVPVHCHTSSLEICANACIEGIKQ